MPMGKDKVFNMEQRDYSTNAKFCNSWIRRIHTQAVLYISQIISTHLLLAYISHLGSILASTKAHLGY